MAKSLDAFAAEHPKLRPGRPCAVKESVFRKQIEHGLKKNYQATLISRWLKLELNEEISPGIIARHKRGGCRCPRT